MLRVPWALLTRGAPLQDMDMNLCSDDPWLVLHKVDSPTKMRYIGTRISECNDTAFDPARIAPSIQPYVLPQGAPPPGPLLQQQAVQLRGTPWTAAAGAAARPLCRLCCLSWRLGLSHHAGPAALPANHWCSLLAPAPPAAAGHVPDAPPKPVSQSVTGCAPAEALAQATLDAPDACQRLLDEVEDSSARAMKQRYLACLLHNQGQGRPQFCRSPLLCLQQHCRLCLCHCLRSAVCPPCLSACMSSCPQEQVASQDPDCPRCLSRQADWPARCCRGRRDQGAAGSGAAKGGRPGGGKAKRGADAGPMTPNPQPP